MDCPINQLPLEILSKIFLHCIPVSAQGGDATQHHIPQLLTRVCRRWYTLALALPALWASLRIECRSRSTYSQVSAIHTHLQRSSTHPLAFSLDAQSFKNRDRPTAPHLSAVLAALGATRERWQRVEVVLSVAQQATINALTLGPAPLLQTFHCDLLEAAPKPASITLFAPQACPMLESLSWTGFRTTLIHQPIGDTAWMHLTYLRLEASLSVLNCLTLLCLSPHLSTAEFAAIDRPLTFASLPRLMHRTLHTLRAEGSYFTTLLNALTLPALTHLRLEALPLTHTLTTGARTGLHALFARSTPPLLTLDFDNAQYSEPDLLRALALVPTLHSLSIHDFGIGGIRLTAALIHALHPGPSPGTEALCPRLRTLHIIGGLQCSESVRDSMLHARRGENARANGVEVLQYANIELQGKRAWDRLRSNAHTT